MVNKFVSFHVYISDNNELNEGVKISTILKETNATYTLKEDVSSIEHKRKKSEFELDKINVRYINEYQDFPTAVFLHKVMDESLITDEFAADILSDMKNTLIIEYNKVINRALNHIEMLS